MLSKNRRIWGGVVSPQILNRMGADMAENQSVEIFEETIEGLYEATSSFLDAAFSKKTPIGVVESRLQGLKLAKDKADKYFKGRKK